MINLEDKYLRKQQALAPNGLYEQIQKRLVIERKRSAKTRQQLTAGIALLLIIGIVNVAIIARFEVKKREIVTNDTEEIIYEAYFNNAINL
jgi:hypothetical protein